MKFSIKDFFSKCDQVRSFLNRSLPIMYWLSKLHKMPIGATFIIVSKNCSTKPLPAVISKIFKMHFKHIINSYDNSTFYSSYKNIRVVETFFPIIEKLNRPIKMSIYSFRTFYATISYNLLIKVLSEIINFVFKWKFPSKVEFSATYLYWTSKGLGKRYFTEKILPRQLGS